MTSAAVFFLSRFAFGSSDSMKSCKICHRVGGLMLLLELSIVQLWMFDVRNFTSKYFADELKEVQPIFDVNAFQRQRLLSRHDAGNIEFLLKDVECNFIGFFSRAFLNRRPVDQVGSVSVG